MWIFQDILLSEKSEIQAYLVSCPPVREKGDGGSNTSALCAKEMQMNKPDRRLGSSAGRVGVGVEGEGSKTPLCVWKDFPRIALRISQDVGHPAGTQRFQMNRSLT